MAQNVLAGHAEHVRAAVLSSAEMNVPAPHSVCVVHSVSRWPVLLWYVLAGHAEHVRGAVLSSTDMYSASLHSCCAGHKVSRWLVLLWYVLAPHVKHVRIVVDESALILKPAPHVGCAMQTDAPPVAYSLAPHATLLEPVHLKPAGHEAHALLLVR